MSLVARPPVLCEHVPSAPCPLAFAGRLSGNQGCLKTAKPPSAKATAAISPTCRPIQHQLSRPKLPPLRSFTHHHIFKHPTPPCTTLFQQPRFPAPAGRLKTRTPPLPANINWHCDDTDCVSRGLSTSIRATDLRETAATDRCPTRCGLRQIARKNGQRGDNRQKPRTQKPPKKTGLLAPNRKNLHRNAQVGRGGTRTRTPFTDPGF